jgi:hypothetical protein
LPNLGCPSLSRGQGFRLPEGCVNGQHAAVSAGPRAAESPCGGRWSDRDQPGTCRTLRSRVHVRTAGGAGKYRLPEKLVAGYSGWAAIAGYNNCVT